MVYSAEVDVYLDTDVLVNLVYGELPHAAACGQASQYLHDADATVYVSTLAHVEFAQAFRVLATRQGVVEHLIREFDLASWNRREVRERWLGYWCGDLQRVLASFPRTFEVPVALPIVRHSVQLMGEYVLRSQDAVHLATALHYEIPVFWTCDDHFARVDDLHVEIIRDGD